MTVMEVAEAVARKRMILGAIVSHEGSVDDSEGSNVKDPLGWEDGKGDDGLTAKDPLG